MSKCSQNGPTKGWILLVGVLATNTVEEKFSAFINERVDGRNGGLRCNAAACSVAQRECIVVVGPISVEKEGIAMMRYNAKIQKEIGGICMRFSSLNHFLSNFKFARLLNADAIRKADWLDGRGKTYCFTADGVPPANTCQATGEFARTFDIFCSVSCLHIEVGGASILSKIYQIFGY